MIPIQKPIEHLIQLHINIPLLKKKINHTYFSPEKEEHQLIDKRLVSFKSLDTRILSSHSSLALTQRKS